MKALLIFIKNPIEGKVKTRLAQKIGNTKALSVYLELLNITREAVLSLPFTKILFYSDYIDQHDDWDNTIFDKQLQQGNSLGQRMAQAFQYAFSLPHIQQVSIIGSDCPAISPWHITKAFYALDTHDFVIGPANDGGYYQLGMKRFSATIFENKTWSSSVLIQETIDTIRDLRKSYYLLPPLNDVDTFQDCSDTFLQYLLQKKILTKQDITNAKSQ